MNCDCGFIKQGRSHTSRNVPESNDISIDATVGWTARNRHCGITKNRKTKKFVGPFHHPDYVIHNILLAQWNQWKSIYTVLPPKMLISLPPQFRTFKGKGAIFIPLQSHIHFSHCTAQKHCLALTSSPDGPLFFFEAPH